MQGYRRAPAVVAIVMSAVITVCFAVLGLYALLYKTLPFLRDTSPDAAVDSIWGRIAGAVMFLVALAFVIALIVRVRRQDCISFDNPEGEVIIAISAIEDFIRRLGRGFHEVRDIAPAVVAVDGGVAIEARVTLWDDQNIHAACERIQKVIRSQVQTFFGLANVHTVKIFIARTIPRTEPAPPVPVDEYAEEHAEEPGEEEQHQ